MNNGVAIYQQLMNAIKKKIVDGTLKIGDKLESERAMSIRYGISRMTVRNAIKSLEEEGIVKSQRGSGTYVIKSPRIESKIELGDSDFYSLSMQIRNKGMKSSRDMLSLNKIETHEEFINYFGENQMIYEIIRLSYINDNPYALQKTYIPCKYFNDAERFDFEQFSLYEYMADYGHRPEHFTSYLRIEKMPQEYLEVMNIKEDKKVFLFDYFGFDKNRELVEYTISYHLPQYSKYSFVTKIEHRK